MNHTHTESAERLEPCPFCGDEPHGPEKSGGSDERCGYNFTVSIRCKSCGVTISKRSHEGNGGWCDDTGQAMTEAIAAWNRRAAQPPVSPVKPWEQRMQEHYADGNVQCLPSDHFKSLEIADWRAQSAKES
jgi:hypothetical protein